jgi:hypothetical protein
MNILNQLQAQQRVGRPTDYTEELLSKAHGYMDDCPDIVPTIVGLCLHTGIAKATAYRWAEEGNEVFKDILSTVNEMQERKLITSGLTNEFNSAITKMMLTKHGYSDKQEVDHTSRGKSLNTWVINPVTTSRDG